MTLLTAAVAALLSGLLMVAGHYLVPVILGREMRPPWTYAWGVLFGILLPFAGWIGVVPGPGRATTLLALLIVIAGAGLGTLTCYAADWFMGYRAKERISSPRAERWDGKQRPPADGNR